MNDAVTTGPPTDPRPGGSLSADNPAIPWSALEIVVLFFLVLVFWNSVANELLRGCGFFAWYYPPNTDKLPEREQLWLRTVALPFQVATVPLFLALLHGVRPARLGLTLSHFGRNLWQGVWWSAFLIPIVFGVFQLVVWLNTYYLGVPAEPHPLAQLADLKLSKVEWSLLLFIAIVAAPVIEELLFRGLLQPWAAETRWGAVATIGLSAVLAVALPWKGIEAATQHLRTQGWDASAEVLRAFMPLLFVYLVLPVFLFIQLRSANRTGPAIVGTSLLFAMVHVSVWPSPIALIVLALGLGTLRERSQSLVGPMVMHSLFNAVSCVLLLKGIK